jgi:hypothetical protein
MTNAQIIKRLEAMEAEIEQLKREAPAEKLWWEQIAGTFENDPLYEKAMRLGRTYRQSQRPGRGGRRNAHR